jgi:uncharacterized protein
MMPKADTIGFISSVFIKMPLLIAKDTDCDLIVVQLGALLHDIADSKFHNGDETIGPKTATIILGI